MKRVIAIGGEPCTGKTKVVWEVLKLLRDKEKESKGKFGLLDTEFIAQWALKKAIHE